MRVEQLRLAYATVARLGSGTAHEAYVVQLSRAFAECGCDTTVASTAFPMAELDLPRRFGAMPVRLSFQCLGPAPLKSSLVSNLFIAFRLLTRPGKAGSDRSLWITHNTIIAWAAALRKQPWVFDVHQIDPRARLLHSALQRRSCRGILFNSAVAMAKFEKLHGPIAVPALISRNAIDPAPFKVAPSQSTARHELGLPEARLIFLYAGSFGPNRGLEEIIAAAAEFERTQPGRALWVLVGGRGEELAEFERRVREQSVSADIRLHGLQYSSRLPLWYAAADCLLAPYSARLPAADVMNPMKLYEYSAAARPIVASNLPAVREALGGNPAALLIKPDSVESLTAAFYRFCRERDKWQHRANSFQREALGNTWVNKAKGILEWLGGLNPAQSKRLA